MHLTNDYGFHDNAPSNQIQSQLLWKIYIPPLIFFHCTVKCWVWRRRRIRCLCWRKKRVIAIKTLKREDICKMWNQRGCLADTSRNSQFLSDWPRKQHGVEDRLSLGPNFECLCSSTRSCLLLFEWGEGDIQGQIKQDINKITRVMKRKKFSHHHYVLREKRWGGGGVKSWNST